MPSVSSRLLLLYSIVYVYKIPRPYSGVFI